MTFLEKQNMDNNKTKKKGNKKSFKLIDLVFCTIEIFLLYIALKTDEIGLIIVLNIVVFFTASWFLEDVFNKNKSI